MPGRPRKPIAIRERDGDTRKLGSKKFAESLEKALRVRQGQPDFPESMQPVKGDPEEALLLKEEFRRRWEEVCSTLDAEGILFRVDGPSIEQISKIMVLAHRAYLEGNPNAFEKLMARYNQAAMYLGMSGEVARAKMPAPDQAVDEMEAALSA